MKWENWWLTVAFWAGQPPVAGILQPAWTNSVMVQISHSAVTAGHNKEQNVSQNPYFIRDIFIWKRGVEKL